LPSWKEVFSLGIFSRNKKFENVQIVNIKVQSDAWVLEKMALKLTEIPEVRLSTQTNNQAKLNYFFNYFQFEEVRTPTAAWFTHIEERSPEVSDIWWQTVDAVDVCVFHSEMYRRTVKEKFPSKECITISPGVDFDSFRPRKLRIGIVGRAYPETGRKGEALLQSVVADHPEIEWVVTGQNWGVKNLSVSDDELPSLYRGLDYVLITSAYEGGPMSALEALASGVPVISPDIGWMPELPHITYEVGNLDQLNTILGGLSDPALELRRSVSGRTWDSFVEKHNILFAQFN
jgi:hypothetical protein